MNANQQALWSAIADQFWSALDQGNIDDAMACCLPSMTSWHNFDQKLLNADEAAAGLRAFVASSDERATTNVRRDFFADGFAQQHLLTVRMKHDGKRRAWQVCVLMRFQNEKIASIDEYIDRAGSFNPDAAPTT